MKKNKSVKALNLTFILSMLLANAIVLTIHFIVAITANDFYEPLKESYTKGDAPVWAKNTLAKIELLDRSLSTLNEKTEEIIKKQVPKEEIKSKFEHEMASVIHLLVSQLEELNAKLDALESKGKK
ncbi:MAG: hypothetical protein HUU50_12700 [Candidatus Brocadiae bacterium]|nr:hypothetical protein [Candidatus Brocadiia bacterium]